MDKRKRPSRNLDYDELQRFRKQIELAEKRTKRPLRKTNSFSTDASQDGSGSDGYSGG